MHCDQTPSNQDQNQIVGLWINDDDPSWTMEFKNNGTCFEYYSGELSDHYTYEIWSEPSSNGKLTLTTLKLTETATNVSRIYDVNTLSEKYLVLEYFKAPGKLVMFSRIELD